MTGQEDRMMSTRPRTMSAKEEDVLRVLAPANLCRELDAERAAHDKTTAVSAALAAVLQREVEWAAKATSPSARMPEYEAARAALAQHTANQPEKLAGK